MRTTSSLYMSHTRPILYTPGTTSSCTTPTHTSWPGTPRSAAHRNCSLGSEGSENLVPATVDFVEVSYYHREDGLITSVSLIFYWDPLSETSRKPA